MLKTKILQSVWLCTKKKRKEGLVMKKMIFVLAVLIIAAPALAQQVVISCADADNGVCVVSFDATGADPNLVRAFALDIVVDSGAKIIDVDDSVNADYIIFPGSIVITGGAVSSYGTAKGDPNLYAGTLGLDPNGMTVEMGSLYYPPGPGSVNAPAKLGELLRFTVDADCNVSISANAARGGVVMEDSSSPTSNLPCAVCCSMTLAPTDCLNSSAPGYTDWSSAYWAKPDCWCYERQCRGDIDGKLTMGKWVQAKDLTIFRNAFLLADADLKLVANGICADLNHKKDMGKRVQAKDLTILRTYFLEATVPSCDQAPIITGPYNFWKTP